MYIPPPSRAPERLRERKPRSLPQCLFEILIWAFAIGFLLSAVIRERDWIYREDRVPASAVITELESHLDGRLMKRNVFVRYTAEGRELESRMDDYFYGMRVGKHIKIYYDRNHPFKIQTKALPVDLFWLLAPVLLFGFLIAVDVRRVVTIIRERKKTRAKSPEP